MAARYSLAAGVSEGDPDLHGAKRQLRAGFSNQSPTTNDHEQPV